MASPAFSHFVPDESPASFTHFVPEDSGPVPADITANPKGEGLYAMWNDKGQKLGIPYSRVQTAQRQGYKFDTNQAAGGLTPAQQFVKDQAADPSRTGGTDFAMRSNPSEPINADPGTAGNLVAGVAKGAGTLATPVLDLGNLIAKHTGGSPVDVNAMLAAHGIAQTVGKFGTIGAAIAPAAVAAPVATGLSLAGGTVGSGVGHTVGKTAGLSPEATALLSDALGLAGGVGGAKLGSMAAPAIATSLAGDPNAAALRGLQVGPKSPKALSTLSAVENARPFLQGAQDLADLQSRISPAKAEIWKPYQQALDAIGNRPVQGPDGLTTVSELENQRLQLSALNRGLKSNLPEAVQLAQQKGMTAAQLLDQEKAVKAALDPELESTGINPQLIRKVFGAVAKVNDRISGKTTLIEPTQPSGLGKIANISIKQPLQGPAQIVGGLRDILAGRPLYAAKPTDLGIKEGFANAGPKPDFGTPAPNFVQPPRQLTSGPIVLPEQGLSQVPPSSPAIGIDATTRAQRLGLLLKAPPIELNGAVAETPTPPTYAGTTQTRLGRLLPSSTDEQNIPLSEKVDIFPNQLPGAKRGTGISPRLAEILRRTGR